MNNTIFHAISPVIIYESILENQEEIKELFYKKFPEHGFDNITRLDGSTLLTGEYIGKSYLHNDKNFDTFFQSLKIHIKEYLTRLGFAEEKFSYHVLKSWYVINTNSRGQKYHIHDNSDLSFVYYVDVPENCARIKFLNQNYTNKNCIVNGIFSEHDSQKNFINDYNNLHVTPHYLLQPTQGKLLIFPSSLEHGVEKTDNNTKRFSIAGDIKLTLRKEIIDYESGLVHPSLWREL